MCWDKTEGLLDAVCCDRKDALLELCVGESILNEPLLPGKVELLIIVFCKILFSEVEVGGEAPAGLMVLKKSPTGCEARLSLDTLCLFSGILFNDPSTEEDLL